MTKRPKPAPIWDGRTKKYRLHFCYGGKQYRNRYIEEEYAANILQSRVNSLVIEIKSGLHPIPAGYSIQDYVFSSIAPEPSFRDDSILTISSLIRHYKKYLAPPLKAESTCKTEEIHLRHLEKFLSAIGEDYFLSETQPGLFLQYKKSRYASGVRTDTVNKELATFYTLFKFAIEEGLIEKNPLAGVKKDKSQVAPGRFRTGREIENILAGGKYSPRELREIKRFRYLSEAEIGEVLSLAKGKWLFPILLCLAYTGMRRGEVLNLEWADIDFDRKIIWIRSKKQSSRQQQTARWLEIPERLLGELAGRENRNKTRYVFTNAQGDQISKHTLTDSFKRLIAGTRFAGIGFHAFRHSLASNLAMRGIKPYVIDEILGHQTQEMRERYRHLFPDQKAEAISALRYGQ